MKKEATLLFNLKIYRDKDGKISVAEEPVTGEEDTWEVPPTEDMKTDAENTAYFLKQYLDYNIKLEHIINRQSTMLKELMSMAIDLKANVLKAGHHGSSSSSGEEFLRVVDPEYAIIQCGENNDFGHPHLSVIRRFERLGINIFRNDLNGQVSVFSDGNRIEISTEK